MRSASINPRGPLVGTIRVPGDKSISQRAVLLGALAPGATRIQGLNPGGDTAAAMAIARALGARIRRQRDGSIRIEGGALRESDRVLNARNSGTSLRLSMGMLAAQPFLSILTGDASLRRRPIGRVIGPLRSLGASITARGNDRFAPVAVAGQPLRGASLRVEVPSAQVKSAILFAAIQADGETTLDEPIRTRDHTERMLPRFGVDVRIDQSVVRVRGPARLQATAIEVPGDPSAAAFLAAAAAIVPGSDLLVEGVGANPTRRAFFDLLARAGAQVAWEDVVDRCGEPVGNLRIRPASLGPLQITEIEAPLLIDELPLVAVLSSFAEGRSSVRGAAELRVKESDRIATVIAGLRAIGVSVEERPDGWEIEGRGRPRGGVVDASGDHRIAMAFLVAGLGCETGVRVDGVEAARVSDPGFLERLMGLVR